MSLTSYRAAPSRGTSEPVYGWHCCIGCILCWPALRTSDGLAGVGLEPCPGGWWTWRRPTLPRLKTQYHWRGGFSRPSSGWDRVRAPRCDHQVDQPPGGLSADTVVSGEDFRGCDASDGCLSAVLGVVSSCELAAARDAVRCEIKPIERLVRLSFTRCRASTRLLSTGWSIPALGECLF